MSGRRPRSGDGCAERRRPRPTTHGTHIHDGGSRRAPYDAYDTLRHLYGWSRRSATKRRRHSVPRNKTQHPTPNTQHPKQPPADAEFATFAPGVAELPTQRASAKVGGRRVTCIHAEGGRCGHRQTDRPDPDPRARNPSSGCQNPRPVICPPRHSPYVKSTVFSSFELCSCYKPPSARITRLGGFLFLVRTERVSVRTARSSRASSDVILASHRGQRGTTAKTRCRFGSPRARRKGRDTQR